MALGEMGAMLSGCVNEAAVFAVKPMLLHSKIRTPKCQNVFSSQGIPIPWVIVKYLRL